ncbi:MAG: PGPGW domain-containing protein [Steroidobacteraceae bacterium]
MVAERPPTPDPAHRNSVHPVMRLGRRIGIAIAGGAVVVAGVALLVLPGPGILTIALGLAILSLEFERPRVWLAAMKRRFREVADRLRQKSESGRK